jgi:tRNA G10  N-methylase Trm11
VQVLRGDMRETLRGLASDRFHAVVTDPPYGLSEPLSG